MAGEQSAWGKKNVNGGSGELEGDGETVFEVSGESDGDAEFGGDSVGVEDGEAVAEDAGNWDEDGNVGGDKVADVSGEGEGVAALEVTAVWKGDGVAEP